MTAGVVIVGAGTAAGECAIRLRQSGYTAPITMLGAEPDLPYNRPPLSKAYLAGEIDRDALLIRPATTYASADIAFEAGATVTAIDRAAHAITLADATTRPYATLVLATGGHARKLACPGATLDGVYYLRTIADVEALRAVFTSGARLVIIGGGYIGLEVAAVAVKRGLAVTVIEAAPRLLARVAGVGLSEFYEQAHREAGVQIHTSATVRALFASPAAPARVGGVDLADGSRIPADFVLAGIGLIPNTELAEHAGLSVENGIWVDAWCRTNDPNIYAIGDCSNHPSPFLGRRARLESVPNALEQGRIAALSIAGKPEPYDAVPWFWSDQYDLKLQAVGLSEGYDQAICRGDMQERRFVLFYLRDGALIAADAVNRPADFLAARRLVAARARPNPAALADPNTPLKSLIMAPAG
jgi:3-phenylpropionate/trans-cinnamate dioxygenase ferredoxin reductase subunit